VEVVEVVEEEVCLETSCCSHALQITQLIQQCLRQPYTLHLRAVFLRQVSQGSLGLGAAGPVAGVGWVRRRILSLKRCLRF